MFNSGLYSAITDSIFDCLFYLFIFFSYTFLTIQSLNDELNKGKKMN